MSNLNLYIGYFIYPSSLSIATLDNNVNASPTRWTVDIFLIEGDNVNSISDSQFNNSVSIYPNPTNNELHIKSITNISKVTLYNYIGKKVVEQNNSSSINIINLNKGVYICKIVDEFGFIAYKKVIKK